jgi:CRP-like cAMP-binding protein
MDEQLARLAMRGYVSGEEVLLSGDPYNASIVAMGDSIVMRLAKSDFEELLKKPLISHVTVEEAQEWMRRGAGLLDVRSATEFQ